MATDTFVEGSMKRKQLGFIHWTNGEALFFLALIMLVGWALISGLILLGSHISIGWM